MPPLSAIVKGENGTLSQPRKAVSMVLQSINIVGCYLQPLRVWHLQPGAVKRTFIFFVCCWFISLIMESDETLGHSGKAATWASSACPTCLANEPRLRPLIWLVHFAAFESKRRWWLLTWSGGSIRSLVCCVSSNQAAPFDGRYRTGGCRLAALTTRQPFPTECVWLQTDSGSSWLWPSNDRLAQQDTRRKHAAATASCDHHYFVQSLVKFDFKKMVDFHVFFLMLVNLVLTPNMLSICKYV